MYVPDLTWTIPTIVGGPKPRTSSITAGCKLGHWKCMKMQEGLGEILSVLLKRYLTVKIRVSRGKEKVCYVKQKKRHCSFIIIWQMSKNGSNERLELTFHNQENVVLYCSKHGSQDFWILFTSFLLASRDQGPSHLWRWIPVVAI